MVSKIQQQQVRQLITQTLTVLCQNSLPYNAVVTIEGLLGITIDHDDVFLVNIQQSIQRPLPPQSAITGQIPVQFIRQPHHVTGNHISTPLSQHSPHELHSPHRPLSNPHGSMTSPRRSLPSPQGSSQGIPHAIPHGLMTSQRRATPSPCQGLDLHSRKRPSAMMSRTPEPGIVGLNEPADLSMRSMRKCSRNRSMSPLAKVPRVSPPSVQSGVEKRISMILETAQAEMKAMEINKRRHTHHYSRHKTEAPPDGFKKQDNHHMIPDRMTAVPAPMIIKVEPRSDSVERVPPRSLHVLGVNEKENHPEAWNILPELTAKWYKRNGRSPNDDILARQDGEDDVTSPSHDVTERHGDVTNESETTKDCDVTNEDIDVRDNTDDVTSDKSKREASNEDNSDDNNGAYSESDVTKCSTVGTILIVKQEMEEKSNSIVSEDKQSVAPSDGGGDSLSN